MSDKKLPHTTDGSTIDYYNADVVTAIDYYPYGLKIAAISSRKMPDLAEGSILNKFLYNDKELIDDADLNWYDYGFRSYDPQIGRFPQLDPLTDDYPELTPYQYASCDPITNIDIDGLEGGSAVLTASEKAYTYVAISGRSLVASAGSKLVSTISTHLALIVARGTIDALYNAQTLGLYDAFGGNHVDSYEDTHEQTSYLTGRVAGDALAVVQSTNEMTIGGGVALSTGIQTLGAGAVAGGVLAIHGAGMGVVASADAASTLSKLYKLTMTASGASDAGMGNAPKKYEPSEAQSTYKNSDKPSFAKDAKQVKRKGVKGWEDKKGNFISKGDKPGEWHINPRTGNRKPLWQGQKPRGNGNNPYWNVNDNGDITH